MLKIEDSSYQKILMGKTLKPWVLNPWPLRSRPDLETVDGSVQSHCEIGCMPPKAYDVILGITAGARIGTNTLLELTTEKQNTNNLLASCRPPSVSQELRHCDTGQSPS